jgi:DNA-binding transcriptional LysR family regulator
MAVFARAIERGSFSAAADDLGLTPSAVSKLVTRLEDRLGVRLLHRSTRRLALTQEGEIYLSRARQILADIDDAEAEVARTRGAPRGRLQINCGTAFGLHQLSHALGGFLARYPEIEIDLTVTDRIVDLVAEHADVAIRVGRIADGPLVVRKLADLERVICAAPSYLARRGTPHAPTDLVNHDCIVVTQPGLNRWPFRGRETIDVVEIVPRVTVDNAVAALNMAVEGVGIVRLVDVTVGEPLRQGRLVALLSDAHYVEPLPLSAVYLAGRHRLPKVRVFLEFLSEWCAHAPWRSLGAAPIKG